MQDEIGKLNDTVIDYSQKILEKESIIESFNQQNLMLSKNNLSLQQTLSDMQSDYQVQIQQLNQIIADKDMQLDRLMQIKQNNMEDVIKELQQKIAKSAASEDASQKQLAAQRQEISQLQLQNGHLQSRVSQLSQSQAQLQRGGVLSDQQAQASYESLEKQFFESRRECKMQEQTLQEQGRLIGQLQTGIGDLSEQNKQMAIREQEFRA